MPQVSDKFGPIYVNVTLDGSGNGQATFQAVGANVRITNLFVKVATTTNQAVCRMYKNYVSDATLFSTTNSGSTGAAAHGAIDLFDGETVIARWTGGDAGAIATATFVGVKIPFGERPTSEELTWDDPIAAGDGSLIYPALKSPNYVAGTTGWWVDRLGNAEFNDVTVRGVFEADGANNAYVKVTTTGGTGFGNAVIYLRPPDLPSIASNEITQGLLTAGSNQPGGAGVVPTSYLYMEVDCPSWSFGSTASDLRYPTMVMRTASHDGTVNPSVTFSTGGAASNPLTNDFVINGNLTVNGKFALPTCTLSYQGNTVASGGSPTVLSATGVLDDPSAMFNGIDTVTVPYTGIYEIGCCVEYQGQATAAGFRDFRYAVNGTDINHWAVPTTTSFNNTSITVSGQQRLKLNANDAVTFKAFQNSGISLNLQSQSRGWVELKRRTA